MRLAASSGPARRLPRKHLKQNRAVTWPRRPTESSSCCCGSSCCSAAAAPGGAILAVGVYVCGRPTRSVRDEFTVWMIARSAGPASQRASDLSERARFFGQRLGLLLRADGCSARKGVERRVADARASKDSQTTSLKYLRTERPRARERAPRRGSRHRERWPPSRRTLASCSRASSSAQRCERALFVNANSQFRVRAL